MKSCDTAAGLTRVAGSIHTTKTGNAGNNLSKKGCQKVSMLSLK